MPPPPILLDKSFQVATGVSVVFLVTALLFLIKLSTFIPVLRFPLTLKFFCLVCLYYAVMIHLLLFALTTWLYSSNFHDTRYQSRVFMALVLCVYFVLILLCGKLASSVFDREKPMRFDRDIWEDSSDLPVGLGIEVYLLLACAVIMIGYIIWNKRLPPTTPHTRTSRVKPNVNRQSTVRKK